MTKCKKAAENYLYSCSVGYNNSICLGFMCLPDDNIAGNMGMLDQVLALKWVK